MTVPANSSVKLTAKDALTVRLGNAGAVDITFNGNPVQVTAADGEVKTLNFTPTGPQ